MKDLRKLAWLVWFIMGTCSSTAAIDLESKCLGEVEDTKVKVNEVLVDLAKPLPKEKFRRDVEIWSRMGSTNFALKMVHITKWGSCTNPPPILDEMTKLLEQHFAALDAEWKKYHPPAPNVLDGELKHMQR
jgi:hypothetical protein